MLARSREIKHPSGISFKTPLLVPSFSSKGFDTINGKSEIKYYIDLASWFITESILISAYDLYHKKIHNLKKINIAEITFIDSGGYETSNFSDFSEVKKKPLTALGWNADLHIETIKNWPVEYPAILVNYDNENKRIKIDRQVSLALEFFNLFPDQLKDFLIKPEKKSERFIDIEKLLNVITLLGKFDIIGITEKELGDSLLERMINISKIRKGLDKAGITSPIHIFGCLDPLTCILYFYAGAEIFDGLTWLRFTYHNCLTIYKRNINMVKADIGIDIEDEQVLAAAITKNIYFLKDLKQKMIDFSKAENFSSFIDIGWPGMIDVLKKIEKSFKNNEA